MKSSIHSINAPGVIGPYSQGVKIASGSTVYVSGQLPIDPKDLTMSGNIEDQTRQSLLNIKAILEEAGLSMDNVVKTTVFLKDINDFSKMNSVYSQFFHEPFPARVAIEASRLPKDALVEIEAIAAD